MPVRIFCIILIGTSIRGGGWTRRLTIYKTRFKFMIVWVLKDNISCNFYGKMGGKVVDSKSVDFSGKELIELAYGWKDIRILK